MFIVVKKTQTSIKKISDEKKPLNEIVLLNQKLLLDVVEVKGHYERTKAAYNRIYYVTKGKVDLHINSQFVELQKGDACFVQKGTIFELEGTFTVIIVGYTPLYI